MLDKLYRFPIVNIIIVLLITVLFGYGLSKVESESDITQMLPKNNRVYLDNEKIKEIYGTGDAMLLGLKSKSGNILTIENLATIEELTGKIELIELPEEKVKELTNGDTASDDEPVKSESEENYDDLFEDLDIDLSDLDISTGSDSGLSTEIIDEVQSLTRLDIIEGVEGGLEPVSLEDILPTNEEELIYFKEKLLSWDLFQGIFYSSDFSASGITILFTANIDDYGKSYLYEELRKLIAEQDNPDLSYYIAGKPVVTAVISQTIPQDLKRLIPFVSILLLLVLFLSFKNIRDVLLPMITVIISTVWTIGLMGFLGVKLSIIGVIIPVLLIAIGSAYGIHIITHYIEEKNKAKCESREDNKKVILETVKNVIFPVFLTALTTFFGFLSLLSMKIVTIKEFGIFVAIGVIIEFILSIYFIPSIMLLLKPREEKVKFDEEHTPMLELFLIKLAKVLKNKKGIIIIGFLIFLLILINGALKVVVDFDTLKFFKKDSVVVESTKFIDENLAGSDTIYLNISGRKDGDLAHPDILKAMDDLSLYLINKYEEIGTIAGFNDMIKRMNQVMHYPEDDDYNNLMQSSITYEEFFSLANKLNKVTNDTNPDYQNTLQALNKLFNYNGEAYNEIPVDPDKYDVTDRDLENYALNNNIDLTGKTDAEKRALKKEVLRQLISQYLVLYSGNMDNIIADDQMKPRMAKVTISLRMTKSAVLKEMIDDIKKYTDDHFPEGYDIQMGGTTMIANELNNIVISGQIFSFLLAILIVFIIITISYRSFVAGFISTIPIIISILINFAIMGYFNLDLNIATALIASLSIGIGIDYTIHFLSFYKKNWKKYKDVDRALEQTFYTSGKAILYNAVSVGLGFAVLLFSSTRILGTFGILITIVMFSSSMGALTIIPVILEMFKPKFVEK